MSQIDKNTLKVHNWAKSTYEYGNGIKQGIKATSDLSVMRGFGEKDYFEKCTVYEESIDQIIRYAKAAQIEDADLIERVHQEAVEKVGNEDNIAKKCGIYASVLLTIASLTSPITPGIAGVANQLER
jgi:hypothetical protein